MARRVTTGARRTASADSAAARSGMPMRARMIGSQGMTSTALECVEVHPVGVQEDDVMTWVSG